MLTAGELRLIQSRVRSRFGVYLRLERARRFYDLAAMPDGMVWLLVITSEKGRAFDGAIDGDTAEAQLCGVVDLLKKDLADGGAPS